MSQRGYEKIHLETDFKIQQLGLDNVKDQLVIFLCRIHLFIHSISSMSMQSVMLWE